MPRAARERRRERRRRHAAFCRGRNRATGTTGGKRRNKWSAEQLTAFARWREGFR